ncbi:hypothetical protein CAPN008_05960 [Capnocytophaga canis]|uniref:hypothetical protein n=1 Tax=Capnocytophaga canis TaxID=1848903 RepID=UPI001AC394B6|nr:hypothetical protein [Capnocytophaga canis]GIM60546.1 hypothetical protein CAPN008_05960 [Capnocytophaga canis]
MKVMYDILKPIEDTLRIAYKKGGRVSYALLRDLQIYEDYKAMTQPKMLRYSILADKYRISETLIREIIKKMSKKV